MRQSQSGRLYGKGVLRFALITLMLLFCSLQMVPLGPAATAGPATAVVDAESPGAARPTGQPPLRARSTPLPPPVASPTPAAVERVLTISDQALTPITMTVTTGEEFPITNTSVQSHTLILSPCPTLAQRNMVYLPLITGVGTTARKRTDPTPQPQATLAVTTTTRSLTLLAGEETTHSFAAEGTWCASVRGNPTMRSTLQVTDSRPPQTYPVTVTLAMNEAAALTLPRYAVSDPDNDLLRFDISEGPANGAATLLTDTLTYTPTLDYAGPDSLRYRADDGRGYQVEGQVNLVIVRPTQIPIAADRTIAIFRGEAATVDLSTLVSNPQRRTLRYALEVDGDYGVATISDTMLFYQQTIALSGTEVVEDSIIYSITSDQGDEAGGEIFIRILPGTDTLVANDIAVPIAINERATLDLATLVTNPLGDDLRFALASTLPAGFDARLDASVLTFTPETDYSGMVGITYVVTDTRSMSDKGQIIFDVHAPFAPEPQIETDHPVRLVLEPSTALFTRAGESQAITLHAYNSRGDAVDLPGDITWEIVSQDDAQALLLEQAPDTPTQVTVTAQDTVGYMQVRVEWDGLQSTSATLMAAELQPGVLVLPDSAISEAPTVALPPALAALPTRSERLAWLRAQGQDDTPLQQFRAVLDTTQLAAVPQVGSKLVAAGTTPVVGEVVEVTQTGNAAEVLYQTVPITQVFERLQLEASYTASELAHMPELESISTPPDTRIAQTTDTTPDRAYRSKVADFTLPCRGPFPEYSLSSEDAEVSYDPATQTRRRDYLSGKITAGCAIKVTFYNDFNLTYSTKVENGDATSNLSVSGRQTVSTEFTLYAAGELKALAHVLYGPKKTFPLIPLAFGVINLELEIDFPVEVSVQGKVAYQNREEYSFGQTAQMSGFSLPSGSLTVLDESEPQTEPSNTVEGKVTAKASIQWTPGFSLSPPPPAHLTGPKAGVYAIVDFPSAFFEYQSDKSDSVSELVPHYGTGTYGIGAQIDLQAKVELDVKDTFLSIFGFTGFEGTAKLLDEPWRWGPVYPQGKSYELTPEEGEDGATDFRLEGVCGKDDTNNTLVDGNFRYEDDNVKVLCKKEVVPCPVNPRATITENYRSVTYKNGTARRKILFEQHDEDQEPLYSHVGDVRVALIEEKTVKEGNQCKTEEINTPEPVGEATQQEEENLWEWSWENIPEGTYKLATFSTPQWFPLVHFHLSKQKDTFTLQVGESCTDGEEQEPAWELVDIEDDGCAQPQGGRSYDDPHNITLDGFAYSTFSRGEFVYTRDLTDPDSFVLQVRQQRLPRLPDWTTVNTAAAFRVGGHVFEVRLPDPGSSSLVVLLDGKPIDLPPGDHELGDAILRLYPGNALEVWAPAPWVSDQGDAGIQNTLWVGVKPRSGLDVRAAVPLNSPVRGMLGDHDGDPQNDIADAEGNLFDHRNDFFEAWRITERDESLFTYAPGEGPDRFNKTQNASPPGFRDLSGQTGGPNYILQATDLISDACDLTGERIDEAVIREMAVELAAGRDPQNLVAGGICFDARITDESMAENFQPTILRLTGQVVDQHGDPVEFANIRAVSDRLFVTDQTTRTDRLGRYELVAYMHDLSMTSGEVRLQARLDDASMSQIITFDDLVAGEINTRAVETPFTLEIVQRHIIFSGNITTTQLPAGILDLSYIDVAVESAERTLCRTYTAPDGSYACVADINTPSAFATHYEISDALVQREADSEAPAGEAGSIIRVQHDFDITPTILHVTGRVRDSTGNPIVDARVSGAPFDSDTIIAQNGVGITDARGRFDLYLILDAEGTEGTIALSVRMPAGLASGTVITWEEQVRDLVPEQVNTLTVDIPVQVLSFAGRVSNGLAPAQQVSYDLRVAGPDGILCRAYGAGDYTCTGATHPLSFPIPVTYTVRVAGEYMTRYDTIPQGAAASVNTPFTKDIPLNLISMSGTISNTVTAGILTSNPIPESTVEISTTDGVRLCRDTTTTSRYNCDQTLLSVPLPLDVRYQVSGAWGNTVASGSITPDALDDNANMTREVFIAPTVLHITGTLRNAIGEPYRGTISAGGALVVEDDSDRTDSAGNYQLSVVLRAGVTEGDIVFTTGGGDTAFTRRVSGVQPGTFNTWHNATTSVNIIGFSGELINVLDPDTEPWRATVTVHAPDRVLCSDASLSGGWYSCSGETSGALPLDVRYEVSADWGQVSITDVITPGMLAASSSGARVTRDIAIAPTTLHLTGQVRTLTGVPVQASVGVEASGDTPGVAQGANTNTNEQGQYRLAVLLDEQVNAGDLHYRVSVESSTFTVNRPFDSVLPNTLITRTNDIEVLIFEGTIVNQVMPEALVDGTVEISTTDGLHLCTTRSNEDGDYRCIAPVPASLPLEVRYLARGVWGETVFDDTVVGGFLTDAGAFRKDLPVAPTMLHLLGVVTDPERRLAPEVSIRISSEPELEWRDGGSATVITSEKGEYSRYAFVNAAVPQGELTYFLARQYYHKPFMIERGKRNEVIRDFIVP